MPLWSDRTSAGAEVLDATDQAVGPVASTVGALGVWRAWQVLPGMPARRLYLAQVDAATDADLPAVRARLHEALTVLDDPEPLVGAFAEPEELSGELHLVLTVGELIWAATPGRVVQVAGSVPPGAGAATRLDGTAREVVAGYLRDGWPMISTDRMDVDRYEPSLGVVVPTGYRTDGEWVWSEAVEYYLRVHGVAPESGLVRQVDRFDGVVPEINSVDVHRVLRRLRDHLDREATR
ncbi:hypothetical protein [Micromonospora marina]|uniref:hypothetical protein n=1 Tax=Micromonospora marina TaxID=307120 RepID=UPI0034541381